jgi:hypothetical protein
MYRRKVILFFLVLISSAIAKSDKNALDWAKQFLNNPLQYFSSSYEKAVFQKFKAKFSILRPKNAGQYNGTYNLEIQIPQLKDSYHLVLEFDDEKRVSSVYRNLSLANIRYTGETDRVILKWLGKLFYRLDAGDSAALYDLIFYGDIKIRYKNIASKREIISSIINQYPAIIQPNEISIQKSSNIYSILISIQFSDDILLQIPYDWANTADTDKMQDYLYQKIVSHLKKSEQVQSSKNIHNKSQLIDYLRQNYPQGTIQKDIIHIPYPKLSTKVLNEMRYKIARHIFDLGFDPTQINSIINLNYNKEDGTVILNNACRFSFYNSPKRDDGITDRSESALQQLYNMLLLFPHVNGEDSYSDLKGDIQYRGYKNYRLALSTSKKWAKFWQIVRQEGSVYFYPSHIAFLTDELVIEGLIYVIRDNNLNLYHFAELKAHFFEYKETTSMELDLNFYPYVNRMSVTDSQSGAK